MHHVDQLDQARIFLLNLLSSLKLDLIWTRRLIPTVLDVSISQKLDYLLDYEVWLVSREKARPLFYHRIVGAEFEVCEDAFALFVLTSAHTCVSLLLVIFSDGLALLSLLCLSLLNLGLSLQEVLLDFCLSSNLTLHPWMANHISQAEALVWMQLQHTRNQILELVRELLSSVVIPKHINSVLRDLLVVRVLWLRVVERWVTRVHNE